MQELYFGLAGREGEGQFAFFYVVCIDDFLHDMRHGLHEAGARARQVTLFVLLILIFRSVGGSAIPFEGECVVGLSGLFVDFEDGKGTTSVQSHHTFL